MVASKAKVDYSCKYAALVALVVVAATLTATGCVKQQPKALVFSLENAQKSQAWPPPPDIPRFRYFGTLRGETDFKTSSQPGRLTSFLRAIVGLGPVKDSLNVLARPQSGFATEDRIYITDMARKAVFVFDISAGDLQVWERVDRSKNFQAPIGVCALNNGSILVADAELGQVFVLDNAGNFKTSFGKTELIRPTGLACDPERSIAYVVDTGRHAVVAFDEQGRAVNKFGTRGDADGEFNGPTHIALADNKLIVSDTLNARVQQFTPEGEFVQSIGKRGLYVGNLVRPKGVSIDSDGNIYVVEGYFDQLIVFDSQGNLLIALGGSGAGQGEFFLPTGVWVDSRDRVFVADMFNGRVAVFQYLGE